MIWQKARSLKHPDREIWVSNYGLHLLENGEVGQGYDTPFIDERGLPYFVHAENAELLALFTDQPDTELPNWALHAPAAAALRRDNLR